MDEAPSARRNPHESWSAIGSSLSRSTHAKGSAVRARVVNDLDMSRWREQLEEVWTDSLWLIPKRDATGVHSAEYHGNFVPQIPRQMMLRYTRRGDTVVDAFMGLGTTLVECLRLGRRGVGVELNPTVAKKGLDLLREERKRLREEDLPPSHVVVGDSASVDLERECGVKRCQLLVWHPPYHDIIAFSEDDPRDLSRQPTLDAFLASFGKVVGNTGRWLERGRHACLVIGDKYRDGEVVPLGFLAMQEVRRRGFALKAVVVKDIVGNERGKGKSGNLWKYRALKSGFYIFRHEYVFVFQKT